MKRVVGLVKLYGVRDGKNLCDSKGTATKFLRLCSGRKLMTYAKPRELSMKIPWMLGIKAACILNICHFLARSLAQNAEKLKVH